MTLHVHAKHPVYRKLRATGITMIRRLTYPMVDRRHNQSLASDGPKILFLRHYHPQGDYHWDFFRWLEQRHPALSARCELRRVGWQPGSLDDYGLLVPLVQDPLKELYPQAYAAVWQLQAVCDRAGVPVINRVDRLSNSRKSTALRLIGACSGVRCPRVIPIGSHAALQAAGDMLGYPFLLRDDLGHGGSLRLIHQPPELEHLREHDFTNQIACEFIDTSDQHGIFRKYRYVMMGDRGFPRHLIASTDPVVRMDQRKEDAALRAEELDYLSSEDPNHQRLDAARRSLGFDVVAFDYSYARDHQMVVWEPNPFAVIWGRSSESQRDRFRHQEPAVHRIYEGFASYYADCAGLSDLLGGKARRAA